MAQHDYNIGDQNGFDFLVDLNNALSAIATNNAGSSEPNTTFAHMFWFDANNDQMKVRNEANSEWVIVATKDGSGWTPYRQGTALGTASTLDTGTGPDQVPKNLNPVFQGVTTTTRLRTTAGNTATPTSTDHPYQIGLDTGVNLRFDDNAIGAFDNGVGSRLTLNHYGGGVDIGSTAAPQDTRIFGQLQINGATLDPVGSAPMYACRAWVNFDGTGTVAIRASGNVSSITDVGVGNYRVNFAIDMEDANYSAVISHGFDAIPSSNQNNTGAFQRQNLAGSFTLFITSVSDYNVDASQVMVSIFR